MGHRHEGPLLTAPAVRIAGVLLLAVLAGCASLPPVAVRAPSSAFLDTRDTSLGRIAAASLSEAGRSESGFRLLPTGDFALDARLELARRAERSIDAQYYYVQRDSVGLQFLRELRNAAQRGVRVRLLVDDLYTAGGDELFHSLATIPNVEIRFFNPLPSRRASVSGRLLFSLHEFDRINHRMHNKLFIADNRMSISGGRNMANEYFMRSAHANFIDLDVLAAGPVVRELSGVFDGYWNSDYAYPATSVVSTAGDASHGPGRFDRLAIDIGPTLELKTIDPLNPVSVAAELSAGKISLTPAQASVLADSPAKVVRRDRGEHVSTVTRSVLEAFGEARGEIRIASPYFIPGQEGLTVLTGAIERGVRIRVMTNGFGATDEPLVHQRYSHYRREMLRAGLDLYELRPDPAHDAANLGNFGSSSARLHAKVAIIDSKTVFIGSMNLDPRSTWSNTEMGLLIESEKLAGQIKSVLRNDRNASLYRLRLANNGESIEWVATDSSGATRVIRDEPDSHWLLRLKTFLLQPFISEDLL